MTDDLIAQIQSFTLNARGLLEVEASQQLEGIYGWLPDGGFAPIKGYPAIAQLEEARETHRRLEQFADDELAAGFAAVDARRKLIRETAFTWCNRLAAFRLLEDRKLLKQTIVRFSQSNGFIYWLTDDANKDNYALHQQGSLPLNAMGEGPSNMAYRRFLLWQCGELARDVSVLFDPTTLASRLCPRPPVLKQLLANMNTETLAEAWRAGNEETIGWIYEGFIEDENKVIFDKFSKGKKVLPEEIGAATQRFTPRWIVRVLTENSLGRLWVEMHPDSRLKDRLAYLVPMEISERRPLKLAREISFLDPCCGSMHFGLVAFDLYVEMYREEMEMEGQPGWPAKASLDSFELIPASIIAHNLHGIDIDLRAVQIAAFALLIKARTLQPNSAFTDLNLACSNVEQISGGRLESLIAQAKFSHPIHERILRSLTARMKDSNQLGSLLRLEKVLEQLIVDERRKAEAQPQLKLSLPGASSERFKTREGIEEFFSKLSEQVLQQLDQLVSASRAAGTAPGHLANEAAKGLRYLRLVSRHHDVVATNPPYMSRRNMSVVIADHLDDEFPSAKGDLYAAFIFRCTEMAGHLGKIAMITQQSFMFISSYEDLREYLRSSVAIETMAHLGPKAFPNITGEKVNTTAFVLRREPDERLRQEQTGSYFRLVRERDAEAKRTAFEAAVAALRTNQPYPQVFTCQQADFNAIPGKPWVYWFSEKLRDLFRKHPVLGVAAAPKVGLQTGENVRFLRKWWEVGVQRISTDSTSCEASKKTGKTWFPYMKGGASIPWFGNQEHVVNYRDDGAELYVLRPTSVIRNPTYYFRKGVTWSDVSSTGFAARLSPGGFIHDVSGMTCFPPENLIPQTLGVLNSTAAKYILAGLNPTIHYQVGDIERLPLPKQRNTQIETDVMSAVNVARARGTAVETTRDFVVPHTSLTLVESEEQQLFRLECKIDAEVSRLYGLNEEDLASIQRELAGAPVRIGETDAAESEESEVEPSEEEASGSSNWNEQTLAEAWISYAFGTVLGRYAIGESEELGRGEFDARTVKEIRALIDPNGLMVEEKDHPQDIVRRTLQCLEFMRGKEVAHALIRTATGEDNGDPEDVLRGWVSRFSGQPATSFWKYHQQLYRNRPIYWPLQSPHKQFMVWVFHERFSKDTLFKVRTEFVEPKLRWLEARIKELKAKSLSSDTRGRRAAEKEISSLADVLDDVQEFANRLNRITQSGYTPHIDDGVLLNAAPLWELLPSWPDTKKAWQKLEAGEYDWAQQAMEYWPGRVKEKCKTDKSFAIAHGLA